MNSYTKPYLGRLFFWAFACMLLIPIWILEFPPFGDMPQHSAQVSIFINALTGTIPPEFSINLFTPYILGYIIVAIFGFFFLYYLPSRSP